jgi:non-heme Fe2+,alpha-ketoglutarate-dependent halogenase
VKMVIGPDIGIWSTAQFIKYPSDEAYVGWHQDGRYWAMLSDQVVTAWIALSPSTRHNGCLLVVPGSHRRGLLPHREGVSSTNILSRQQEVALDITDTEVRRLELSPGEFSLHHVNLVHGSGPNETNQKRVGFVIRYIGPSVQQYRARLDVTMAVGEAASFRHANVVAAPKSDDMVAELEKFESTVRSFLQEVRRAADALGHDRRETRDA